MIARLSNVTFWLSLTIWTSVLITSGIAASFAFTVLPDAGVTLTEFSAIDKQEHGTIAAGLLMNRIFMFVDWVQFIAAPVCLIAMFVSIGCSGMAGRALSNGLRIAAIVLAGAALCFYGLTIRPVMNEHLLAYWTEAKADNIAAAESHREQFNAYHPRAEMILQINMFALLIAITASAAATTPRKD